MFEVCQSSKARKFFKTEEKNLAQTEGYSKGNILRRLKISKGGWFSIDSRDNNICMHALTL